MGTYVRQIWLSEGAGRTRRERRSGAYHAYIPTPLAALPSDIPGDVAADLSCAAAALVRLNATTGPLSDTEGIARLLLRAEAVSSSYIEGLSVTPRRLLRAEFGTRTGREDAHDAVASEILGNIRAMERAIALVDEEGGFSVDQLLDVHRTLTTGTRIERLGGVIRASQNWLGGNPYNPLDAEYVPPPPDQVEPLLHDLVAYMNRDDLPPIVQAALVHGQFETIHPFGDGNGRTGRALIHMVLRRRGVCPRIMPPLSLALATSSQAYATALAGLHVDDGDPDGVRRGLGEWLSYFADACLRACDDTQAYEEHVATLEASWRERLGSVRGGSALDAMLPLLCALPVFSVDTMAEATQRSVTAVSLATNQLADAGIIEPTSARLRGRVFEVPSIIEQFGELERALRS